MVENSRFFHSGLPIKMKRSYRNSKLVHLIANSESVPSGPKHLPYPTCPKSSLLLTDVTLKITLLTYTRSVGLAPPPGLGSHLIERHRY